MKPTSLALLALLTAAAGPFTRTAEAQTLVYGLTGTNQLVSFSTVPVGGFITPSSALTISGLTAGQTVQGIDFRPFDGKLYAVARDASNNGFLYSINPITGVATNVAISNSGTVPFAPTGSVAVDFNPVALAGVNALRVETTDDQNFRFTGFVAGPTTTSVTNNADGALNPGNPNIVGTAYSNNAGGIPGGSGGTVQYAIDATTNALYTQNSNVGTLTIVGTGLIGVNPFDAADGGFDIVTNTERALATLTSDGTNYSLYEINLATGAATVVAPFAGTTNVRDIAAPIPEPATLGLLGLGAGLIGLIRRRSLR